MEETKFSSMKDPPKKRPFLSSKSHPNLFKSVFSSPVTPKGGKSLVSTQELYKFKYY